MANKKCKKANSIDLTIYLSQKNHLEKNNNSTIKTPELSKVGLYNF